MNIEASEKMKKGNILIFNTLTLLIGIVIVIISWSPAINYLNVFNILLGVYGFIKFLQYLNQEDKHDYENLLTMLVCFVTPLIQLIGLSKESMLTPFTFLTWISLMAIVKLIKLDYLHDRSDESFKIKVVGFLLFVVLGFMTNYTLLFVFESKATIIGFFFIINGIISLGENLFSDFLTKKKRVKNAKRK